MFYQKTPYEYVQQEYENAQKLMGLGIRVPEPFEIVNQKGRYGIIYEKIHGEPIQGCMNRRHIREYEGLKIKAADFAATDRFAGNKII